MALVVEDGTGRADAESYMSVADLDAYHTRRGNTRWTGDASAKEAAAVKATEFLDKFFGRRFVGVKYRYEQALEWPRDDAYDGDYEIPIEVPQKLKKAHAELALRALIYDVLAPDVPGSAPRQSMQTGATTTSTAAAGEVEAQKIKVGPIEVEAKYKTTSESRQTGVAYPSGLVPGWVQPIYSEAVAWIESLLVPPGRSLMRA